MIEITMSARARALITALLLILAPGAYGANKLYVANNGVDSASCGGKETPCRSITQGIANAAAGDTIVVGPGKYGDLNGNGTLGETGEETPAVLCGCMLAVDKSVTLVSSDGAAVTNIDATTILGVGTNVAITASGVQFGAPRQGFTVTNARAPTVSDPDLSFGFIVFADNTSIRGNRVVHVQAISSGHFGTGLSVRGQHNVIEGNEVIGWATGIDADSTINQNAVHSGFATGILALGAVVTGNIVTDYKTGIALVGDPLVLGNAVYGNITGISAVATLGGIKVEGNNIFGNGCGLSTDVANLLADHNFWGAPTGPGADPGDDVCGSQAGTAIVTPYATKPFNIKLSITP